MFSIPVQSSLFKHRYSSIAIQASLFRHRCSDIAGQPLLFRHLCSDIAFPSLSTHRAVQAALFRHLCSGIVGRRSYLKHAPAVHRCWLQSRCKHCTHVLFLLCEVIFWIKTKLFGYDNHHWSATHQTFSVCTFYRRPKWFVDWCADALFEFSSVFAS